MLSEEFIFFRLKQNESSSLSVYCETGLGELVLEGELKWCEEKKAPLSSNEKITEKKFPKS